MDLEVPYLSFSGGEPMVHPRFFDMVEYVCSRNGQLKVETNGHYLTPENCERLKALGVKAVQVSIDGASRETFNRMRVRGDFDLVVAMYHDQGHGPVKVLGLEAGVNVTVGLPFVRTSVDHGTAFDIAGTGRADERSLLAALQQAVALAPDRTDRTGAG